jgi:hypothetical protein
VAWRYAIQHNHITAGENESEKRLVCDTVIEFNVFMGVDPRKFATKTQLRGAASTISPMTLLYTPDLNAVGDSPKDRRFSVEKSGRNWKSLRQST